jgi:hypothetical protein
LPAEANKASAAKTNVYGYLLATVNPANEPKGSIRFDFQELKEANVPAEVITRMGTELVHECFERNSQALP